MIPLRGLWNKPPAEGDFMIACEADWTSAPPGQCIQYSVSGNSPVALSQICALVVDNTRCAADVTFIFTDSGFTLTVPAKNSGVFPVFTNGLTFYASATAALLGDITSFLILNSIPPPIPIAPSVLQNHASTTVASLANGSSVLVAAGQNGTLNTLSINISATSGASAASLALVLQDGAGHVIWSDSISQAASTTQDYTFNFTGLAVRFQNGLNLVVSGSTNFSSGQISASAFYSQP